MILPSCTQPKLILFVAHITDSKKSTVAPEKRHGIHSTKGLPFHSDVICDILALHDRQQATRGGIRYIASSRTIVNELNKTNPKHVETLCEHNWPIFT